MRLPPLKHLRVHNPKRKVENPCLAVMSSVLGKSTTRSIRGMGAMGGERRRRMRSIC